MSTDCVFCKILEGQIPSHRVAANDQAVAFLDVNPLRPGHTLVVPRRHAPFLRDVDADDVAGLWSLVHEVTRAVTAATRSPAATVAVNDGKEAGQEVPHVHVHVVPRKANDGASGLHSMFRDRPPSTQEELRKIAQTLRVDPA